MSTNPRGVNRWPHGSSGRPGPSLEMKAKLREMHEAGVTVKAMAEHFGVSRQTLNYWVKKHVLDASLPPPPPKPSRGAPPDDERLTFQLILDRDSAVIYERRRFDCGMLKACEWEWVKLYGAKQGRCPTSCPGTPRKPKPT